jgi:hypothetical protein
MWAEMVVSKGPDTAIHAHLAVVTVQLGSFDPSVFRRSLLLISTWG